MRIRLAVASVALLLASCGSDSSSTTSNAGDSTLPSAQPGDTSLVDFAGTDVYGESVDVGALAAGGDVVVWFWAPW